MSYLKVFPNLQVSFVNIKTGRRVLKHKELEKLTAQIIDETLLKELSKNHYVFKRLANMRKKK